MNSLICTMASGWYKKFAPIFEYTAKKYNPGCDVKVFDKDDIFPGYPDRNAGALRFLIPNKYFEGYDYIYITDIDFVFLPHDPPLFNYHIEVMRRTGLPYSAYRGPKSNRGKRKWHGRNTRITGGIVCVSQEWLAITERIRQRMLKKIRKPFTSRCDDEIMLYRIMRCSGLKTPKKGADIMTARCLTVNTGICISVISGMNSRTGGPTYARRNTGILPTTMF